MIDSLSCTYDNVLLRLSIYYYIYDKLVEKAIIAFNVASLVGPMAASKLGKVGESSSILSKLNTIKTSGLSNVKNFSRTFMSEYSKGGVRSSFLGSGEIGKVMDAFGKAIGKQAGAKLLKPDLLAELSKKGVKYNLDDVVMVGKDSSGKLLWLEKGMTKQG